MQRESRERASEKGRAKREKENEKRYIKKKKAVREREGEKSSAAGNLDSHIPVKRRGETPKRKREGREVDGEK